MANTDNAQSLSALLTRVLTELWRFSVDTFVDKDDIEVMTEADAQSMMNRILGNNNNN